MLRTVCFHNDDMNFELQQLSDKIDQLVALITSLRQENAQLRVNVSTLSAENTHLSTRMQEAHRRMSALLEKIPASHNQDQEVV